MLRTHINPLKSIVGVKMHSHISARGNVLSWAYMHSTPERLLWGYNDDETE